VIPWRPEPLQLVGEHGQPALGRVDQPAVAFRANHRALLIATAERSRAADAVAGLWLPDLAVEVSHRGLGGTGFAVVRIGRHRAISFGLGGVLYACIQLSQASKNQVETVSWGVVSVYTFIASVRTAAR
jgi:hypothetical protein